MFTITREKKKSKEILRVNFDFQNDVLQWLQTQDKIWKNTIGGYISFPGLLSEWLKITEICCLTVLEFRIPKSRCQLGHTPSKTRRAEDFCWWLLILGVLGLQLVVSPFSASVTIWPSPCVSVSEFSSCKDTSCAGLRPTLLTSSLLITSADSISK